MWTNNFKLYTNMCKCYNVWKKRYSLKGWNFVSYGSRLLTGSEDFRGDYGPVNDFWGHNKVYEGDITFNKLRSLRRCNRNAVQ